MPDPEQSRAETLVGAVLYLMTAYHRTHCPRIAACVAAHLECIAGHPEVDPTIRQVCAGMCDEWHGVAGHAPGPRMRLH
jgi:acyl-[acyl carrier protein]--UDP-N-acetylglucosamine O-acyltransferase